MIHTLQLGVPGAASIDFWEQRLKAKGANPARVDDRTLRVSDPDGLQLQLVVADDGNPPLRAAHPDVPAEHAITGLEGARAFSMFPTVEESVLTDVLGFEHLGGGEYRVDGEQRHFHWAYDPAPADAPRPGAGTVHHIAWASQDADHVAWQERVGAAGGYITDVIDRDYFNAIYFREPRGVLFEIATLSPGFATDEAPDRLGEELRLPKQHEHLRAQLERTLRPVVNPRTAQREAAGSEVTGVTASLASRERPAAGEAAGLLVLHHGRGADENDLLGLADVLDPARRLHVVTPGAPLTVPGWPGKHWYLVPRVGHPDPDTFWAAHAKLSSFHDGLWERTGISPSRTVFGGFSMGSVMSYALGLDPSRPAPAGLLALSGFVPTVEGWTPDVAGRAEGGLRAFVAHGRQDQVMEVGFARRAHELLEAGGIDVEYHESDAAHHIDPNHVPAAVDWLAKTL